MLLFVTRLFLLLENGVATFLNWHTLLVNEWFCSGIHKLTAQDHLPQDQKNPTFLRWKKFANLHTKSHRGALLILIAITHPLNIRTESYLQL